MKRIMDGETLLGMGLLVGLGLLLGFAGNLIAGPTRKLEWGRDWPEKGKPNCPQTLPVPGQEPPEVAGMTAPMTSMTPMAPMGIPEAMPLATAPMTASAPEAAAMPEMPSAPGTASSATVSASAPSAPATASAPAPSAPAATAAAPAAAPAASVVVPPVPPDQPWIEATPAQVDALHARGALFVDARATSQYQEGHVKGAIAIPIWESEVDAKIAAVAFDVEGDMAKPIVVYCNGGECEDSHNLGQKLWEAGHVAVYVYKDGYPDWIKRGRPVSTGDAR